MTNSQAVANCAKRRIHNLKELFGSKCCLCGFNEVEEALEFHHINPQEKEFGISRSATKSLELQLKEVKKCILLCANCHRGVHYGYYKIPNDWQNFFNEELAQKLLQEKQELQTLTIHYCQKCGKIIDRHATYCVDCYNLMQRTVERPDRNTLKFMIRTMPFTQIAQQYGVTDNAIRKWCDAENLPRKKTDIQKMSDEEWEKI